MKFITIYFLLLCLFSCEKKGTIIVCKTEERWEWIKECLKCSGRGDCARRSEFLFCDRE